MKKVLVLLADGFEEIEAVTIIDILRRAEAEVTVAGLRSEALTGAHGVKIIPDKEIRDVKDEDFDMLVLPGGQPGVDNLRSNQDVLQLVKKMHADQKIIGAICAAPWVLRDAELLSGVNFTCYPGFEDGIPGGNFEETRVVNAGNIITSRGPGTALEFSLALTERLNGTSAKDQLSAAVLANA